VYSENGRRELKEKQEMTATISHKIKRCI